MSELEPRQLPLREAGIRILDRRPDLSKDRVQRQLSRDLAREVECWEDALEVLAGWLASCTDARMPEAQGSFLRSLDALEAADGVGAESSLERRSSEESRSRRADAVVQMAWMLVGGAEGRETLRLLASVDGRPLPRALLRGIDPKFDEAVDDLQWLGLCSVADGDRVGLPPRICAYLQRRHTTSKEDRLARNAQWFASLHQRLDQTETGDETMDEAADILVELPLDPRWEAYRVAVAHRIIDGLRRRGDLDRAQAWLEQAEAWHADLEATDTRTQVLGAHLTADGSLLDMQGGRFAKARAGLEAALQTLAPGLEEGAEGTASLSEHLELCLAQVDGLLGNLDDAERTLLEWVVVHQGAGEAKSEPMPAVLQALGDILVDRGELARGLVRLRQAYNGLGDRQLREEGIPFALALARGLRSAGRGLEAEALLERARVASGGEMDRLPRPWLPLALHEQGVAAGDRQDWAAAAILLDEAAMLAGTVLGNEHPLHAQIQYTRGLCQFGTGDIPRARKNLEYAVAARAARAPEAGEPGLSLYRSAQAFVEGWSNPEARPAAIGALHQAGDELAILLGERSPLTRHVRGLEAAVRRALERD